MTEDTTPRRRRTKKISIETKRRARKSGAAVEIDRRIADIIKERTQALNDISRYIAAQDRYQRLTHELNELIGMQAKIAGNVAIPAPSANIPQFNTTQPLGVPSGVGSIPAQVNPADVSFPKVPKVSAQGNVAEMVGEEGFK